MQSATKLKFPAHAIGWAIFFFAPLLLTPGPILSRLLEPAVLWPTLLRNLMLMGLFYLNLFYLTPVILKRYGLVPFLITMALIIVIVTLVNDWIHTTYIEQFFRREFPRPDFGGKPFDQGWRGPQDGRRPEFGPGFGGRRMFIFSGPLLSSFLVTTMIASVSTSIVFWNDWNIARQTEQERALQKVASELAILKLQVSPHFLFNTLNNIRWLIRSNSDRAEEAVVKLSQLLRYILYQTNAETVALEKEVDNLRDLITLQKMRLVNEQQVEFIVEGNVSNQQIIPLLFVPLVENFFKHGDFDNGYKSFIHVSVNGDRVVFKTENAIRVAVPGVTELKEDSGIGVANVKKRLALHYPGKHMFHVSETNGVYKLELDLLLA